MASNQTKVVRFHQTGDAFVLQVESENLRVPQRGEVRIKAAAIGLNRAEIMFRNGAYLEQPQFPSRLGYEVSGTIDAVGDGVEEFRVGDQVSTIPAFSMGEYGVYAEYPVVPASAVAKYPPSLSASEGTAIWMQYITAYGALIRVGSLDKGQTILITAASSSVGIATIQIANMIGATVIATTRGANKIQPLLDAGAHHVIQTDTESVSERTLELTGGKGANLIFDPIGGPLLADLGAASAQKGTIIEYGALDERPSIYPLFDALGKGLSIIGYTLFEITQDPERLERAKSYIYQGLEEGALKPVLDKEFSFDEIQKAHQYMEANNQIGKIIVRVQD